MQASALQILAWRDPVEAARALSDRPGSLLLLSDGGAQGRWSYLASEPDRLERLDPADPRDGLDLLRAMLGPRSAGRPDGPPFQGGVVGLIAYEYADRLEPLELSRDPDWPDLVLLRYPALLAFDHEARQVLAVGRGEDEASARTAAERAAAWLDLDPGAQDGEDPLAEAFTPFAPPEAYEAAVADVVRRIGEGEIFQANIARAWTGRLAAGRTPFDAAARLARSSPAPFSAWLALDGLALVSHSPERFLKVAADARAVETRPIKGTRPRGADAAEDRRLAQELLASAKDRAENLMIVDLMRNDLARVCAPGEVRVAELFGVETYPSVHHLVSTVTGQLAQGRDAADLLRAAFPPGSITGAPKVQAMRVIAGHEGPRGPWCGSLFWAGFDGALDSSVLIRTAAFVRDAEGWRFRALAGAGIVADSDPEQERLETEAKISGLRRALTGPAP